MIRLWSWSRIILVITSFNEFYVSSFSNRLLRDLPSPSFLIDLQVLEKRLSESSTKKDNDVTLPKEISIKNVELKDEHVIKIVTKEIATETSHVFGDTSIKRDFMYNEDSDLFYVHSTVIKDKTDSEDILAVLDLPRTSDPMEAQLVLGLNNHHCISYYWARSAGAGASMDAIGVEYESKTSELKWAKGGFINSNSNDGKRSEWCNFLRKGDQVQLKPLDLLWMKTLPAIYGITRKDRPLGSEPCVVCKFEITE